jgi:undecaprenyl-diphosphatase
MSLLAWFHALDLHVLYLINQAWSWPWLDPVMARVSDFDSFRWPLALAVVLTLIWGGFRGRLFLVLMAACLFIGDGLIDWTFKVSINRPRPSETEPNLRVVSVREITPSLPHHVAKGRSFTSGHACNNVALAMVGCALFGRWAFALWPWAALVSYSRVYCAAHYPSDIVGSWVVAVVYSYFILKAAAWLWRREGPRYCPRLHERHPLLFPLWPALQPEGSRDRDFMDTR